MDVIFVPFGLGIILAYHVWLWHKSRRQPFTTTFGIDADGRRLWIPAMMKVYYIDIFLPKFLELFFFSCFYFDMACGYVHSSFQRYIKTNENAFV